VGSLRLSLLAKTAPRFTSINNFGTSLCKEGVHQFDDARGSKERRLTGEYYPAEIAPGEAYLVHRFALHGVAPWDEDAKAGPDGRMIAYFRPELPDRGLWLNAP